MDPKLGIIGDRIAAAAAAADAVLNWGCGGIIILVVVRGKTQLRGLKNLRLVKGQPKQSSSRIPLRRR